MARTKGVNKTSAVQNYLSKNSGASAQEVMEALKALDMEVAASHVYNVKATMKKKKSAKKSTKKKAGPKAAKSVASSNGATKADQIRDQAKSMPKPVRPKDVVAALKERGVEVLHTHVSQILASMGMKKKKRKAAVPAVASNGLNINDLVMAKKLVAQVGSIEKVREALAALARLG